MVLFFCFVIFFLYSLLYLKAKKTKTFFHDIAAYVYEKYPEQCLSKQRKEDLQKLEPTEKASELEKKYGTEKIKLVVILVFLSTVLAFCLELGSAMGGELEEGERIARNNYGSGKKEVTLWAESDQKRIEVPIEIEEKHYTQQELEVNYADYLKQLEKYVLQDNREIEHISKDMVFPLQIKGYPFQNEWECSDYTLLESSGKLGTRTPAKDGELVVVTVMVRYFEWQREHSFAVRVWEKELSWEEAIKQKIIHAIGIKQKETKEKDYLYLPKQLGDEIVTWKEKKEQSGITIFLLGLLSAGLLYGIKDNEIRKKVQLRNEEMMVDYPEIVSKITLFLGAGMSLRQTIEKIANEYAKSKKEGKQRRYAFEEILLTYYEMERGVSEMKAYEHMGKRCKIQSFMKLGTLLAQNSKKGNSGLLKMLQKEGKDAFEERKNQARKKGEEAGTKLLLPMMIMLSIVMIIIIVPAFLSFQI